MTVLHFKGIMTKINQCRYNVLHKNSFPNCYISTHPHFLMGYPLSSKYNYWWLYAQALMSDEGCRKVGGNDGVG